MSKREDEEQKKDRGSSLGEAAGKRGGQEVGKKLASQGASKGAEAAGSGATQAGGVGASSAAGAEGAAAGGAGTAVGTASGTAAGAAGGAGAGAGAGATAGGTAGAAGGPAAPITVPLAAAAGAVIGKYWKKIPYVVGGGVIGCFSVVTVFLAAFIAPIILILLLFGLTGGGSARAVTPTGGAGLVDDFCLGLKPKGECIQLLKQLLEEAAASYKMPAGVLGGVLSIEGPQVFGYSDEQITQYGLNEGGRDPVNSTPNECGAVGPMQFLTGSGGTAACPDQTALRNDEWSKWKEAVNEAKGLERQVLVQNIMDALYAGAKKLRTDATAKGVAADKVIWDEQDVYKAAEAYSGACQVTPTFNYCETVWVYYRDNRNTGLSGDNSVPNGWPTSGYISSLYGVGGYGSANPTQFHSGLDIAHPIILITPQNVYASVSGKIAGVPFWNERCGGQINVETSENPSYQVVYLHLNKAAIDDWKGKSNSAIEAGTLLGDTEEGIAPSDCWSGKHLHYEIYENGSQKDPLEFTPFKGQGESARGKAVSVGGGNWLP